MPPRRNRVTEHLAAVIAYASGTAAAFAPPSPTGRPLVDAALVGVSTAAVVYGAASAPWWALGGAAGAALVVAVHPVLFFVAAIAFVLALMVGVRRQNMPEARAVSAGLTMNVLAWAALHGFFGLTAIVGLAVAASLFFTGFRRRPQWIRQRAWRIASVVGVLAAVFAIGFAVTAVGSRADLKNGNRLANEGIAALNTGDFAVASERFAAASLALDRAEDRLRQPWTAGGSVVPVVAQHRAAVLRLSEAGAEELAALSEALAAIDPATLRAQGGRIDLAAVAALADPFARVDESLATMATAVLRADSPWLVPPVADQLESLSAKIARNATRVDNAVTTVDLAPALLGAGRPAVYLVLFTSPAEARGLGGFIGNYAELTITEGQLALSDFGRISDLQQQAHAAGLRVPEPAGFLARYGRFGFDTGANGGVGNSAFGNLTMTPHFPWVGEVGSALYTGVTGHAVDGVIAMDAYVIEALLAYTGPIDLTTFDVQLTADNAADYILREQYEFGADDNTQRIDALGEAAELTTDKLLAGTLPDPTTLARDLGPFVGERRLLMWARDLAHEELLRRVGLAGAIPPLDGADGWSVAITNASGNKIDAYLQRQLSYEASTDEAGLTAATMRIELTNTAPSSGLPNYVIGNLVGLPSGTSRLYVSAYSALGLSGATLDGTPTGMEVETEVGWNVYSRYVDIPAGGTVTLELSLAGSVIDPQRIVTWQQPLVRSADAITDDGGD